MEVGTSRDLRARLEAEIHKQAESVIKEALDEEALQLSNIDILIEVMQCPLLKSAFEIQFNTFFTVLMPMNKVLMSEWRKTLDARKDGWSWRWQSRDLSTTYFYVTYQTLPLCLDFCEGVEGATCRRVKIGEETTTSGIYEIVCNEGAEE